MGKIQQWFIGLPFALIHPVFIGVISVDADITPETDSIEPTFHSFLSNHLKSLYTSCSNSLSKEGGRCVQLPIFESP